MTAPGRAIEAGCRACGTSTARVLPFRYAFQGRYLHGVRCAGCSLVYVHPQPTAGEIREMYGESYFTVHGETEGAHGPAAYMELARAGGRERAESARRLDRLVGGPDGSRGRFLEIGCGPGFFLAAVRELGWQVAGLELSAFAVEHARRELGLEVTCSPIETATLPEESFDAVLMGDVLEHLADPVGALRRVRSWMRPGGRLVVAVPSTLNLASGRLGLSLYGMRRKFKTLRIPPYHLFEYVPRTLRDVVSRAGFEVASVRQSAVPIGKMGLRGSPFENAAKVLLQVPAIVSSHLWNVGGDRLRLLARRL